MKIQDTTSALRTINTPVERDLPTPSRRAGLPDTSIDGDRADLTSSQLARAAAADSAVQLTGANLTTDRIQAIRQRISTEYYNRPAIVDQTVDNISGFYSR